MRASRIRALVYLVDKAPVTDVRKSREGYLQANARAARTGVYTYRGDEVERPDLDVVRVYRPSEEVFKRDAIKSFTSLDVTLGHPDDMVGPDNWRDTVVGFTGEDVVRDGEFVRVPLTLRDHAAIAEVENGCRELSFGYYCQLEFKDGKAPNGEPYDAIQRNLQGNHLAIVPAGRAGSNCRIGDAGHNQGAKAMPGENVTLRAVDVNGVPVRVNDDAVRVIETLQAEVKKVADAASRGAGEHAATLGARDAEITTLKAQIADKDKLLGSKDAEITTLKAQVADASQIDALAAERAELFARAGALGLTDADVKGKSTEEIVKLAVGRSQGDDAIKDKDANYLRGVFDYLSSNAPAASASGPGPGYDPIARVMRGGVGDAASPQAAWQGMVDRMQNAWKAPTGVSNANGR